MIKPITIKTYVEDKQRFDDYKTENNIDQPEAFKRAIQALNSGNINSDNSKELETLKQQNADLLSKVNELQTVIESNSSSVDDVTKELQHKLFLLGTENSELQTKYDALVIELQSKEKDIQDFKDQLPSDKLKGGQYKYSFVLDEQLALKLRFHKNTIIKKIPNCTEENFISESCKFGLWKIIKTLEI